LSPETPNSLESALLSLNNKDTPGYNPLEMKLIVHNEITADFPILHINSAFSQFSGLNSSEAEKADFFATLLNNDNSNLENYSVEKQRLTQFFHQVGFLGKGPASTIIKVGSSVPIISKEEGNTDNSGNNNQERNCYLQVSIMCSLSSSVHF
jgi:hypothetical protein